LVACAVGGDDRCDSLSHAPPRIWTRLVRCDTNRTDWK
jgi:hypothetical protein